MSLATDRFIEQSDVSADDKVEQLDVRGLGAPEPLSQTLERLAEMDDGVLIQINDRAPRHLYPKLEDRGYDYATHETEDEVVTLIWE